MILLAQVMAGCEELFPIEKAVENDGAPGGMPRVKVEGKEAVMRLQYAIRRLLKVICSNLKGTVLFIDDLQVRLKLSISVLWYVLLFLTCLLTTHYPQFKLSVE